MNVEQALEALETITARLEREDLPLDQAIALFEEGLELAASVKAKLDEARLKMERVVERASGIFDLEPFDVS